MQQVYMEILLISKHFSSLNSQEDLSKKLEKGELDILEKCFGEKPSG